MLDSNKKEIYCYVFKKPATEKNPSNALFALTPPRTPRISGLKSQILKPTFLS